jgi:hypothetical protein
MNTLRRLQTLGLLAVAAILLTACGATTSPFPASANTAPPPAARVYAQRVLAQAALPPEAKLSNKLVSSLLDHPFVTSSGGGADLHKLYLISGLPPAIETFIKSHLPTGAKVTTSGTIGSPTGSADVLMIALTTAGPYDYSAELVYEIAADSASSSEVRVDAEVVVEPRRASQEMIPAHSTVTITGFAKSSLFNNSTGPVTVKLPQSEAERVTVIANHLPVAPQPDCMEYVMLYKIAFRSSGHVFDLQGVSCGSIVLVTRSDHKLSPLHDATCKLLRAVVKFLPKGKASSTRSGLSACPEP